MARNRILNQSVLLLILLNLAQLRQDFPQVERLVQALQSIS